ncbi:hypothetical protein JOC70_000704 [Clostridium pascui]|uniref:hypothetical protein n=1 Tax=Clostridium pascui TaxID=46609 RepID=UPI0019573987|nr:hypothetical protein [Clostridium pascui]MBM7869235.1 hypothetical protein [Clostridium pascui]
MRNEADEFEKFLILEAQKELKDVAEDIKTTLKKKVQENVYNSYSPLEYNRAYQLRDNITTSKNNKETIISWESQEYINNQFDDVSNYVPEWINDGYKHKDWTGGVDYYHQRPSSNFIEETVEEINKKYGENICEKVK